MTTAWVAQKSTPSETVSVSWRLAQPTTIRLICFTPGYAKSVDRFRNNQRLKQVSLILNGETQAVSVPPVDEARYQSLVGVPVRCPGCTEVKLTVVDTYATPTGEPEVAISEVIAYQDPRFWPLSLTP